MILRSTYPAIKYESQSYKKTIRIFRKKECRDTKLSRYNISCNYFTFIYLQASRWWKHEGHDQVFQYEGKFENQHLPYNQRFKKNTRAVLTRQKEL